MLSTISELFLILYPRTKPFNSRAPDRDNAEGCPYMRDDGKTVIGEG